MGTGVIAFHLNGKRCIAHVSNAASKAHLETLAHALHDAGLTHAGIPRVAYTESVLTEIPEYSAPESADVGIFANCLMRRSSDGKLYGLLIHAPNLDMFELVVGRGYRVTAGDGLAIAAMYSDCAGETFTFHEGWLQGSSLRGLSAPE